MANVNNVKVDRIKQLAKANGITMKYLCDCLGKHRGFLSCVRNGTDRIDEEELAIIAAKIGTTAAYLTGQTDDPEVPKTTTYSAHNPETGALTDEEMELLHIYRQLQKSGERQLLGKAYELLDAQNASHSGETLTPPDISVATTVIDSRIKK